MGFDKTVKCLSANWSVAIEELFYQSFQFTDESIYSQLFVLFCSKKFKDGIIFILNNKSVLTKEEVTILQDSLDEYTLKDIMLTLIAKGSANYSKILFILENLEVAWVAEFVFYILNKVNIQSLNIINITNFMGNIDKILKNADIDTRYKIIKVFEKNIIFWHDQVTVWNVLLNYEIVFEIFLKQFFATPLQASKHKEFLQFIDCGHYLKIMNFLTNRSVVEKNIKNNFYQFLSEIEAQQFLETFLNFLLKMNIENITQFSANFSAIPFFKAAIMRKNYESEQLLRYLFFIYSSYLNLENKIKLLKDILESEKNIVSNSTYLENLPYHFIDMLVRLEIKSDSGLLFVLDVVDKKGRPELISNLPKIYQNSSPAIKSKINEIFLKHSLKSIVSDEKRDLNINAFVEILKKLPDSVSGEIISLIYNASASIKIRLINIIELLNFDRGIEKIIERLVYREKDKKVKATCIRLLKLLDQETALKHLRILLFDDEPRVRANAIEAFEYFATADNWFVLLALANDSNNRVRANVAKAIFPFSRTHSIEILNGMLNSDRELFVLSALWVIEKLSLYNEFTQTLEKLNRKSVGIKIRNKLNKIFTQIMKVKTSD